MNRTQAMVWLSSLTAATRQPCDGHIRLHVQPIICLSYLIQEPWRFYDQFIHHISFHVDVALKLLSKVLVKVRVVPLSNLSHVPSLQSFYFTTFRFWSKAITILRFGCLGPCKFLRVVVGLTFRADSNYSPATLSGFPIPTFELSMVETKALSNGPLQPYGTDCTTSTITCLSSHVHETRSREKLPL